MDTWLALTHTEYEKLSVSGGRSGGGGEGWRVRWIVNMSLAVPSRTYYLYQNVRTSMRELAADGTVVDHQVYSFCECWKVSHVRIRTTSYRRIATAATAVPTPTNPIKPADPSTLIASNATMVTTDAAFAITAATANTIVVPAAITTASTPGPHRWYQQFQRGRRCVRGQFFDPSRLGCWGWTHGGKVALLG